MIALWTTVGILGVMVALWARGEARTPNIIGVNRSLGSPIKGSDQDKKFPRIGFHSSSVASR